MMRIVVDAMGSDNRPQPDVKGAMDAALLFKDDEIILVGQQDTIAAAIAQHGAQPDNLRVVHARDIIQMSDKPSTVGKDKPESSMHVGLGLVKSGEADAFVTAGNTGAAHAIAMLFTLRRIANVKRPALALIFPIHEKPVIFLDVGANAEARPDWLAQYAIMGSVYASNALGLRAPKVGLVSNGEEEGKGTAVIQEAGRLIKQLPLDFVGNIEPANIHSGLVDVVVADGFTGNILIKTFESATRYLGEVIRKEIKASFISSIGGLLARGAFQRVRQKVNADEIGGAPLLGVNGVVIIAHGSSDAKAIKNAIGQARIAVQGQVVQSITEKMQEFDRIQGES